MSDPISALAGATATGIAEVTKLGLQGMLTLRGDLADGTLRAAAAEVAGAPVPGPGEISLAGDAGLAWMSPDELLLLCPHAEAAERAARLEVALEGTHSLVANVSDARALFALRGPHAAEVLAKLAPVDVARFAPGMFRRTRLAQIPAAFWRPEPELFHIITFRSVARYAFDVLHTAAAPGSEVGAF
ncbi:MAG: sarcosine oxidase subunit gamma family protein [Pseudomonadota bacterium]